MDVINWEERHFQVCLALLSNPEITKGIDMLEMVSIHTDRIIDLMKKNDEEKTSEELFEREKDGKYGFVNAAGYWIIEPIYDEVDFAFNEGLAWAKAGDKLGYINLKGDWIIPPKFEDGYQFRKDVAAVKIEGKWGLINKTGEWIVHPVFEDVHGWYIR